MRIVSHRIAIALIFNSSVRPLGDARESAAFSGSIVCFPNFPKKALFGLIEPRSLNHVKTLNFLWSMGLRDRLRSPTSRGVRHLRLATRFCRAPAGLPNHPSHARRIGIGPRWALRAHGMVDSYDAV
jgi:hypothetical protein